ncbi:MAG: polyprenyl synthetase family protein [Chitinophagaceae bacterium]|nr:polyprenyl synthetase family protein [Bacteroidota bacterium]MCC6258475.1 polyprenyl synthetase family protein [Chitinophagaceae bacterium]
MHSFSQLSAVFEQRFNKRHFPEQPVKLYDASQYILGIGGKRVRPVCVLMGNELFGDIHEDAYEVATAVELFHNFTLVHDDIMDKAPMRRGMETVHTRYGESTALLAGDVMLVKSYEFINLIQPKYKKAILSLFNTTASAVCEGQQLDMNFESEPQIEFDDYANMIALKTSVLLGASLQMGAIIGGAGLGNQQHIYAFGKMLGMAFQVQDDYLDAFGDPAKFGKLAGGDILANKKTFLLLHAMDSATAEQKKSLDHWYGQTNLDENGKKQKVEEVIHIFKNCGADNWAGELKEKYYQQALDRLEDIAVVSARKKELADLANYLMNRDK